MIENFRFWKTNDGFFWGFVLLFEVILSASGLCFLHPKIFEKRLRYWAHLDSFFRFLFCKGGMVWDDP